MNGDQVTPGRAAAAAAGVSSPNDTVFNPAFRRAREEERFAMTGEQYLNRHNIPEYLTDAVRLLAENASPNPLEFLATYLMNVLSGDNVIFRNFAYVQLTPRNRRSLVRHLRDTYRNFDPAEEISIDSLHQLFCLLCPDYPIEFARCAHQICSRQHQQQQSSLPDELPSERRTLPFADFSLHGYLFFFFSDFLRDSAALFKELDERGNAVVSRRLYLGQVLLRMAHGSCAGSVPDSAIMEELLNRAEGDENASSSITFDQFCSELFAHPNLPNALVEPRSYTELREGIDRLLDSLAKDQTRGGKTRSKKGRRGDKK